MLDMIAHRGPDDQGIYRHGPAGLGNRRLSIIDLSGGKQPMANEDGTIWIVNNGEIYNYLHLRYLLEKKGHTFRTHSDTEVIVHLYEEYGEQCVEHLDGMFAIAIWDSRQALFFLARDRIGQKPLYYVQNGDDFFFASEIKALLALSSQDQEIDLVSLHHYLSLRFIPPPRTIFSHIQKLPAAHILTFKKGTIRTRQYWRLSFHEKLALTEHEYVEGLREKLVHALESHLISDVPIGSFLSGGLDSSMIVAILARDLGVNLKTFAVGVAEDDFNELPFARQVADDYNTEHIESCVASNFIQLLPRMIWHLDEPSDPIAACMFYAAELASQHVKVVLGGDGGDELFAGFDRYTGSGYLHLYGLLPLFLRQNLLGAILNRLSDSFTYKSLTQKLRWVHRLSLVEDPGEQYAAATSFFRFSHAEKKHLYSADLWQLLGHQNANHAIVEPFYQSDSSDLVDRMLYADFMTRLPEHSLMLTDRMTMAHGLEARSPYLDHHLVEYLASFPSHTKIRNRKTKYIFRKLAEHYLPSCIVRRKKQGFMFPVAYWFKNDAYPLLQKTLLEESHFVQMGFFRKKAIQKMLNEHKTNQQDHHVRLWMLLNLEIWYRIFIQRTDCLAVAEDLGTVPAG